MDRFNDARGQKIFKGHQSRDRQKGIYRRWSQYKWVSGAFKMKHEVIKLVAYMQRQKKKDSLHGISKISDILPGFSHMVIIIYIRRSDGMTRVMFSGPLFSGRGLLLIFPVFFVTVKYYLFGEIIRACRRRPSYRSFSSRNKTSGLRGIFYTPHWGG